MRPEFDVFPFNWFPQRVGTAVIFMSLLLFFLALFPFNWFPQRVGTVKIAPTGQSATVSIQLVSPASGDDHRSRNHR